MDPQIRPLPDNEITPEYIRKRIQFYQGHINAGMYDRKGLGVFFEELSEYLNKEPDSAQEVPGGPTD